MKSSNHVLATTILIGNAVYTESFQASVPFIQKRSLPATLRSTLNEPTINLSTIRMHRSSNLHSTSKQSNEIDLKTQEKEESTDKNDNNPLNEVMASFPPFNFDLDKFMASMPFKFDDQSDEAGRIRTRDLIRNLLKRLANLSLQDYYWRSDFFKKTEADRQLEQSLARMMGEEAAYVRPMDAGEEKIGPLGRTEKQIVKWLSLVIEEEGRRARLISSTNGDLVRPMDLEVGGPLSNLESSAVTLLERIRSSEKERVLTSTLRPKDLEEEKRGPLGDLEAKVVSALDEIKRAEKLRMEQSQMRGGEIVRPIDVPGPLGEMELWYLELITAEKQRVKDREKNQGDLVRPKDASIQGPMGTAERQVSEAINVIKEEERERLKNVKRFLEDKRPMEADRKSALGWTEALIVGMFRAPQLLFRVVDRVKELMQSEELGSDDKRIMQKDDSNKKD